MREHGDAQLPRTPTGGASGLLFSDVRSRSMPIGDCGGQLDGGARFAAGALVKCTYRPACASWIPPAPGALINCTPRPARIRVR